MNSPYYIFSMSYTLSPIIPASAALLIAIIIVLIDFFFPNTAPYWVALLWILLFTTIVIMAWQSIHSAKKTDNYADQLTVAKERLTQEIKHRLWAEKKNEENKIKSQFIDESIPVMLAYFTPEQRCRYHNRIYRQWFGAKSEQIDGHLLQEFSNEEFSSGIQTHIHDILSGKTIHAERILKSVNGFPYIFTEQYIPHLDNKGKIIGFYTLHTPRVQEKQRYALNEQQQGHKPIVENKEEAENTHETSKAQKDASQTGITATRIAEAIKNDKFRLFAQKIIPIDSTLLAPTQYEILIRMNEEENNLMPPGSFLPLVDQYNMMPKLDRWVVQHAVHWIASISQDTCSIFCLNIAKDTLCDPTFADFIQTHLQQSKIPAHSLCFEIEEKDAESNITEAVLFLKRIHKLGCVATLCSFGQNIASAGLLTELKIDYLKIDGSIICNMLDNDEDLIRVKEINQLARKRSIQTIAELVENVETLDRLREIGIHYAQGFGIAKPGPLTDIKMDLKSKAH